MHELPVKLQYCNFFLHYLKARTCYYASAESEKCTGISQFPPQKSISTHPAPACVLFAKKKRLIQGDYVSFHHLALFAETRPACFPFHFPLSKTSQES